MRLRGIGEAEREGKEGQKIKNPRLSYKARTGNLKEGESMPRRLNGEGSIRERSDGRFEAKIQVGVKDGKKAMKYFYGKTKREAKQKLDEYLALTKAGTERNVMTLETYINWWLKNVKKVELKPTSYARSTQIIDKHIIPRLGYYGLTDLTSGTIQTELINHLISSELAQATIKKTCNIIKACLQYAVNNHMIAVNPAQVLALPRGGTQKQIEILDDKEIERFFAVASNNKYGDALILLLYTGLRRSEALALQWGDYNREKRYLKVSGSLVLIKDEDDKYKMIHQTTGKTKNSTRNIYLSNKALDALERMRIKNYHGNDNDYIISDNRLPVRPINLQRAFDKTLKDSEITHKGLHSLRHTFASMLIRKNVDIKIVSELLGHADVAFTYNQYVHIIEDQKASALKNLNDL